MSWDASVAGLGAVTLDELVATAGLLTRVDRKYVVPVAVAAAVVAGVGGTRVLDIDGRRASAYASVYFDTPDLRCFRMSAHPRRRRVKVRSRTYLDSGDSFTEVKTRGPRGVTVKDRTAHAGADDVLEPCDLGYVADVLRARGAAGSLELDALAPVLRTTYARTTLALPDGARATVDLDLAWHAPDGVEPGRRVVATAVVETKSPGGPTVLDRALWRAGVRPARISKFGAGLTVLDPSLPAHRWRSALARLPLAPAPLAPVPSLALKELS